MLTKDWLAAAFTKSDDEFCVKPEFRTGIEFTLQDIRREMPEGSFHLILCRHLALTYFDEALQKQMLEGMLAKLVSGGFLITGKQEPLPVDTHELQRFNPPIGAYLKRG